MSSPKLPSQKARDAKTSATCPLCCLFVKRVHLLRSGKFAQQSIGDDAYVVICSVHRPKAPLFHAHERILVMADVETVSPSFDEEEQRRMAAKRLEERRQKIEQLKKVQLNAGEVAHR